MEEKRLSVNYAKDLLDQLFPFPGIVLSGKGFHLECDHYGAVKNGHILPTGQWYAPSAVIKHAWYCMVVHGIAWYCMVLNGIS